jgi:hypothetical protein
LHGDKREYVSAAAHYTGFGLALVKYLLKFFSLFIVFLVLVYSDSCCCCRSEILLALPAWFGTRREDPLEFVETAS